MKTVGIKDILDKKYGITDIAVIKQTNLWSNFSLPEGRIYNGFLLILSGECTYSWAGGGARLRSGDLIYLPKGSRHTVTAPERSIEFYRINFSMNDVSDGEEIVFSQLPQLICRDTPKNLFDICEELRRATLIPGAGFRRLSLVAQILDFVFRTVDRTNLGRLGSALEYINNHYTEEIEVSELAERCFMSEAHLFRLFKKDVGMSPIEYKNHLRIRKAETLLLDPDLGIGEIAALLGFENACYFSRLFKNQTGISPMRYRSRNF